jgi:pseudouridine-5'-phosphate glycosidase
MKAIDPIMRSIALLEVFPVPLVKWVTDAIATLHSRASSPRGACVFDAVFGR